MMWQTASIAAAFAMLAGQASAQDAGVPLGLPTPPVFSAPTITPTPVIPGPILRSPQDDVIADRNINQRIESTLKDAGAIPADPPDHAYGAFQRGFYLTAFAFALEKAKNDDAAAQTLLGELLTRGLGVKQDHQEAAGWYELAAQKGDPEAQYALARLYLNGRGVDKNSSLAASYLEKAGKNGQSDALRELAYMLLEGKGRDKNPLLAAAYLRRAADDGDMDSQYALAGLFAEGVGVAQSEESAARWYAAAARSGHVGAQIEYAIMLFNGRGIDKDEAVAARWFRQAAESGNPVAQIRLAKLLAEGRGIEKDEDEAVRWYRQARTKGIRDDDLEALSLAMSLRPPGPQGETGAVNADGRPAAGRPPSRAETDGPPASGTVGQ